jgi:hypothetical protein
MVRAMMRSRTGFAAVLAPAVGAAEVTPRAAGCSLTLWARAILLVCCCSSVLRAQARPSSDFLYVWTASADTTRPDFLAVFDVRPAPDRYGRLVTTVAAPGRRNGPHHTEHEMPASGRLFANGFGSGQTFIFDTSDPARPRLDGQLGDVAGMMHPHSYLRLPNGNVLATFQMQHDSLGAAPGGLAELTDRGGLLRQVSANRPGVDRRIRPYSAVVIPKLDRIVTTTADMHGEEAIPSVQLWRLSDLQLLRTFDLPHGPRGDEAGATAEPRLLDDGKTVLVSTFDCGLYLLTALEGPSSSGQLVASFPRTKGTYCAVPVIAGRFYLITVPAWNAVVSLDITNPAKPREVSRLVLGEQDVPHWIALEPNHRRVVITGYGTLANRVVLATLDEHTGGLAIDRRFRDDGATEPGVRMDGKAWPHGGRSPGIPHGAVFSLTP